MNLISYSLFGDNPIYTIGAIKNAELAKIHFPEWKVRVYHNDTVPQIILQKLNILNVELINEKEEHFMGNCVWRFKPLVEPEINYFISRDCDSRLGVRDVIAVNEWIASDKKAHIIRDHPGGHHWAINAGMWGAKGGILPNYFELLNEYSFKGGNIHNKTFDQVFLQDYIYPLIINDTLVHDEYYNYEPHAIKIKHDRSSNDFAFIGESIDQFDQPRGDQRSPIINIYYNK